MENVPVVAIAAYAVGGLGAIVYTLGYAEVMTLVSLDSRVYFLL